MLSSLMKYNGWAASLSQIGSAGFRNNQTRQTILQQSKLTSAAYPCDRFGSSDFGNGEHPDNNLILYIAQLNGGFKPFDPPPPGWGIDFGFGPTGPFGGGPKKPPGDNSSGSGKAAKSNSKSKKKSKI